MSTVSVPIRLFLASEEQVISIELKNGQIYRGTLENCQVNMNCRLSDVTLSDPETNTVTTLESVFIRGSQVHLMVLPPLLSNSNMFEILDKRKEKYCAKKQLNPQTLKRLRRKNANKDLDREKLKEKRNEKIKQQESARSIAPPMPMIPIRRR